MLWKRFNKLSMTMAAPLTAGPWLAGPQAPVKGQLTPAATLFHLKLICLQRNLTWHSTETFKSNFHQVFYSISKMTYL